MKKAWGLLLLLIMPLTLFNSCAQNNEQIIIDTPSCDSILEKIRGSEKWQTEANYAVKENWLALEETSDKRVDLLYFYPETYFAEEGENEVCTLANTEMRNEAQKYISLHAGVFADECRIFAPFYRQIDREFLVSLSEEDRELAYEYSASRDPSAALDYYFAHYNNGRPFILAGHDQGSEIVRYLLAVYMKDHPDLYERMIAAYPIGCAVTRPFLNTYKHLKFAKGASDTGVIISYNTEGQKNYSFFGDFLVKRLQTLVINPLSWKIDNSYVSQKSNCGMLDESGNIIPGQADARLNLERGTVVCDNDDALASFAMTENTDIYGEQSYHLYDYQFFYVNLKENVKERVDAYFSK